MLSRPLSRIGCLLATLLLSHCQTASTTDDPAPIMNALPAITQEGKNTFGVRLDGTVWQPDKTAQGLSVYYGSQGLNIRAAQFQGQAVSQYAVSLYIGTRPTKPGTFALAGSWNQSGATAIYVIPADEFRPLYQQPGKLIISRLDTVKRIIAGEFEAEVISGAGKHQLTEGRFDVRY